ncbi:MAG: aldehyde ferredoxin oxidoreductase family protein [Deltaproteobacteria bacterium]|nr:aldehyde ferredoxin oxidoreductase family protein [Deltaproteobacteria bacterium]
MFGCQGKVLRVNLSDGRISEEELSEILVLKFLGGAGLATKYLWDSVPRGADPLGAENALIFMTGALTGAAAPSTGRYSVVFKSPLTGIWAQANSAGHWGVDLKRTGFDGVIIQGISPKPVYLIVTDGKAELRDASHLWGKSVSETTQTIKAERGEKFNVACIGIAGENQVRYASIMNDLHRAAGRCGGGTVMGSKRLKAITVIGTKPVNIANPSAFKEAAKRQFKHLNDHMLKIGLEAFGTNLVLDLVNVRGGFPTRNWQTGMFPEVDEINAIALREKVLVDKKTCFSCPIRCGRASEIRRGAYKGKRGEGPEFETVGAFGGMCGISDLEAITMANYLCNDYGLDTISTGSTIAFAMECYEKGILAKSDTEGLELKFGDPNIMIELVHKIAKREGIGDLLAEGVRRVSEKLGKGTDRFAMHVKGLELPAYDSRAVKLTGLTFATANRGGDHITGYVQGPTYLDVPFLVVEESMIEDPLVENVKEVKIAKDMEDALTVFDCAGACKFMGMCLATEEWIDLIKFGLGWDDFSVTDFRTIGERVINLARVFSVREGLTGADDTLPKRLLEEPLPEGPAKGHVNNLAPLLDAYYLLRGWDKKTGKPTRGKLRELGLEEVIPLIWD